MLRDQENGARICGRKGYQLIFRNVTTDDVYNGRRVSILAHREKLKPMLACDKISCNINELWENRMSHARDCKTDTLFYKWASMGPKKQTLLNDSWAGLFRRKILPELPVKKMAPAFHEVFGRPTKQMYTTLGGLIFQQMFDTTYEETVERLAFNLKWHYALDGESDAAKYVCPRPLWTMGMLLGKKELDTVLFSQVTERLAKVFPVDTKTQWLDSFHIASNMRLLGRIGIFVKVITRVLLNLRRHHKDRFESLPASFPTR